MEFRKRTIVLIVPVLAVATWTALVRLEILPPSQAAAPLDILRALGRLLRSGELITHATYSLLRLSTGVVLGTALAIGYSLAVTLATRFATLVAPTVQLLAGVPVVLWMPFCVMLFGTDEQYKAALVTIASFFLVQLFVLQALYSTERQYLELADLYEKSRWTRVRHVLLPAAMPAVFTSVRFALASAWVILFFVEFASSQAGREGLGWFIADARHSGKIEEEFAGLIWLAFLAYVVDLLIAKYSARSVQWVDVRRPGQWPTEEL